ncbi:MAG: FecR family protein [Phycisphaeraceae bacterium]|nr:FecR family protein [Phycisphaeraceae bacterium]
MTDPNRLIDAYLDGTLTEEELDQLEQVMATNAEYADSFASAMMMNEFLGDRFRREALASTMQMEDGGLLGEEGLKALQDDYDQSPVEPVNLLGLIGEDSQSRRNGKDSGLAISTTASALSYEAKQIVRSRPAPFIVGGLTALAALLLIAIWLINPFAGDNQPVPGKEFALPPVQNEPPAVATLTAEHGAIWQTTYGTNLPALGDGLRPGQRLTLMQGFAEITTNRGAVAILEAPATIELTERDNGLILMTGKLAGVCETESSKGFVVRTPTIDVTDLGTRFGVAVGHAGESVVQVFEGRVVTNSIESAGSSRELGAGESLAFDPLGAEQEVGDAGTNVFARLGQRLGGVAGLTGDVQWSDSKIYMGTDQAAWPNRAHAVVMQEQRGHTLQADMPLSLVAPGRKGQTKTVSVGTKIHTYILLFNPGGELPLVSEGMIAFDGEILGIVVNEQWHASLRVLGDGPEVELFDDAKGLGSIEEYDFDAIDLRSNGRTLAFKLKAGLAYDAVRIVVRSPPEESN